MSACNVNIQTIYPAECLSDSLSKLNTNFQNLQTEVCTLKETVDAMVEVRTFWYYGPNAENDPKSGMQSGLTTRPSNNTIKAFVNSPTQLNLPAISDINDKAYVIFQKTGFKNNQFLNIPTSLTFGDHFNNLENQFAPTFFIWELIFDGTEYNIVPGFPAISRAQTGGTPYLNWNQPQSWTTYT